MRLILSTPQRSRNPRISLPFTDMIFAEVVPGEGREPEVIGYSRVAWREEGNGERRYMFFGRIIPAWRPT